MAIPGFVITTLQPLRLACSLTLLIFLGFLAFAQAAARDTAQNENQVKPSPPSVRIGFCFENGLVTGDGAHIAFDNRGDIRKSYRGSSGDFQFGE